MGSGRGRSAAHAAGRGQKGQAGILPVVVAPKSRAKASAAPARGKAGRRPQVKVKSGPDVPVLPIVVGVVVVLGVIGLVVALNLLTRPASPPPTVAGIPCDQGEHTQVHYHAAVQIVYDGAVHPIPSNIGIVTDSAGNVTCYYWLHVHAQDENVIHIESPATQTFTLGQFFQIWNSWSVRSGNEAQKLDATHVSTFTVGPGQQMVTYVDLGDGKGAQPYSGDPSSIVLKSHEVITIEVTPPQVSPPPSFTFPAGI